MRFVLIYLIKGYWFLVPAGKRRSCIYNVSCSKHVYEITESEGFIKGVKSFIKRYKTCRPNHQVIFLEPENTVIMRLNNGEVLQEKEIALTIRNRYKNIN